MNPLPSSWLIPIGAIVAALIAGLFSFFNLILSKEQNLSELRQQRIDGLREDISTYISALLAIEYLDAAYRYEHGDDLNLVNLAKVIYEPHVRMTASYTAIILRLDPTDKSKAQAALLAAFEEIKEAFLDQKYSDCINHTPEVRKQAQLLLNSEWERVKRGETTFRWSKRIALLVVLGTLALGGYLVIQSLNHSNSKVVTDDPAVSLKPVDRRPLTNYYIELPHTKYTAHVERYFLVDHPMGNSTFQHFN